MLKRVVSGSLLLVLLFFVILKGGIYVYLSGIFCSIVGLNEYFNVFNKNRIKELELSTYVLTIALYTLIYFYGFEYKSLPLYMYLFTIYLLILVGGVLLINKKINRDDLVIALLGYIYVSIFLSHIHLLSINESKYIWLVFIFASVTDMAAYFSGMFFGKRKLIPEISPKKTVEGAIGGIVGTTIVSLAFAIFINELNPIYFIPFAIVGSIVSQLGDLFASAIKREFGVKDYGNIIPGHGGVLDRFDSILFVAPLTYYGVVLISFLNR